MLKGNLLIVDDEPLLLKNLKSNLEDYADAIFTANDGIEALEIIQQETIHCIVCDINMPRMNGVELIKKIREQNNNVPFVFFTGHGNRELMLEAVRYGAFDFLDKPHFDGLEEVISRGMENGFSRDKKVDRNDDDILSEYHQLLRGLE